MSETKRTIYVTMERSQTLSIGQLETRHQMYKRTVHVYGPQDMTNDDLLSYIESVYLDDNLDPPERLWLRFDHDGNLEEDDEGSEGE